LLAEAAPLTGGLRFDLARDEEQDRRQTSIRLGRVRAAGTRPGPSAAPQGETALRAGAKAPPVRDAGKWSFCRCPHAAFNLP
jgi:hypothetical protein